jgi:hypothetical protein
MILADGYYEWRQIGKHKQPSRIMLKSGEPFAMAGINAREPTVFDTAEKNPANFAILTTKANEAVSYIHDRMPVILPLGREKEWLPPNPTGMFIFPRISAELLTSYPVTPKMDLATSPFNEPGYRWRLWMPHLPLWTTRRLSRGARGLGLLFEFLGPRSSVLLDVARLGLFVPCQIRGNERSFVSIV